MVTTLKYNFCNIEVYLDYIIIIINEGVTISPEHNDILINISRKYFKNKHFGYITHRVNSYSVDPSVYFETSKIENLAAFAVVSSNKIRLTNTQIEKLFLNKPFKHFLLLDDAIIWVTKEVKQNNVT